MVIDTVLEGHAKQGCMFAPGARERLLEATKDVKIDDYVDWLVHIEEIFRKEEIYCPHEGIDRRAEFGL